MPRLFVIKETEIVRRIDDLGRVVIPKETRRTMRIKEGEPSFATLTDFDRFYLAIHSLIERIKAESIHSAFINSKLSQ